MDDKIRKNNRLRIFLIVLKVIVMVAIVLWNGYMVYSGIESYKLDIKQDDAVSENFLIYFSLIVLIISFLVNASISIVSMIGLVISIANRETKGRKLNIIFFSILTFIPMTCQAILFFVGNSIA